LHVDLKVLEAKVKELMGISSDPPAENA